MTNSPATKPLVELGKGTHYHITLISGSLSMKPIIVNDPIKAQFEYEKLVRLVCDQLGAKVEKYGENHVIFDDGTRVRWFTCYENCSIIA